MHPHADDVCPSFFHTLFILIYQKQKVFNFYNSINSMNVIIIHIAIKFNQTIIMALHFEINASFDRKQHNQHVRLQLKKKSHNPQL